MVKQYKVKYSLSVGDSDLERMTMLGEIYMPYCIDFLFENGLKEGITIADVGCGPGNVSVWLADQVGVSGKVFSIDNSDEQLSILNRKILETQLQNVLIYKSDIYEIDKIQQRFDIIFCRFLLVHLAQPIVAIQKLQGLLKPGGRLILAELDNSTWYSYPSNNALENDINLLCDVTSNKGTDFCIGPKLYGYLRQEKFHSVHVKIAQPALFGKYRDYLILKFRSWARTYLEFKLISQAELEKMISQLYDLAQDQNNLLAGAKMYLVCGQNG